MTAATTPWTNIKQLYFRFGGHYLPIHDKLHRSLDIAYSIDLPDIDLLFTDGALRTTFRSDAVQIIKDEVIAIIEPLATATVTHHRSKGKNDCRVYPLVVVNKMQSSIFV